MHLVVGCSRFRPTIHLLPTSNINILVSLFRTTYFLDISEQHVCVSCEYSSHV